MQERLAPARPSPRQGPGPVSFPIQVYPCGFSGDRERGVTAGKRCAAAPGLGRPPDDCPGPALGPAARVGRPPGRYDSPTGGCVPRGAVQGMRNTHSYRVERLPRALDATTHGTIESRTANTAKQDQGCRPEDRPSWGPWPRWGRLAGLVEKRERAGGVLSHGPSCTAEEKTLPAGTGFAL